MALVLLANNSSSNKLGYYWIKGGGFRLAKKIKKKEKINVGFLIVLIIGTASCIIKNLINEGI